MPPIKVFGYTPLKMKLSTFREFDDSFKDNSMFKLADIPLQFDGLYQLKFDTFYVKNSLEFEVNAPISLYIAVDKKKPHPLDDDFLDTQELISVFKISKTKKSYEHEIKSIASRAYSGFLKFHRKYFYSIKKIYFLFFHF